MVGWVGSEGQEKVREGKDHEARKSERREGWEGSGGYEQVREGKDHEAMKR